MNNSTEAAEQVVRMTLNGVEVAAKISGAAAERLAVMLYAILRDQKRTKGKIRLENLLRGGKELKVFAVRDDELALFCREAKKYGVLYCVLKDTKANDGLTDIMVRAEDAAKINRIFERFKLATVDLAAVETQIEQTREVPDTQLEQGQNAPETQPSNASQTQPGEEERLSQYLSAVLGSEEPAEENPMTAQTEKSHPSEPSFGTHELRESTDDADSRPSVRKALQEIREHQKELPEAREHELPIPHRQPEQGAR